MNILWDFDGTLFDTYPLIVENIYKEVPKEKKHIISKKHVYALAKVKAQFAMDMLEFDDLQRKRVYERQFEVEPELTPPFPYVKEVLSLADKNVIVTHKSHASVLAILKYYGMEHFFEEIITKDNGFPKKPNHQSYSYIHERHHIDLVIGDRQIDLQPASQLNIKTCSFQNILPNANFYIQEYSDFVSVLLGITYRRNSCVYPKPNIPTTEGLEADFASVGQGDSKVFITSVWETLYIDEMHDNTDYVVTNNRFIDMALFALEYGFSAKVIKTILFQEAALKEAEIAGEGIREFYDHAAKFITKEDNKLIHTVETIKRTRLKNKQNPKN